MQITANALHTCKGADHPFGRSKVSIPKHVGLHRLGRKPTSFIREAGPIELRFQPDLVDRERVSAESGSKPIRTRCIAAANRQAGPRRGRIIARVRKVVEPRAPWQMRLRPEPDGRDARQSNPRRTPCSRWRPMQVAASLHGSCLP